MSKEKQIEWLNKLAEDILEQYTNGYSLVDKELLAIALYNIGCRKQEWISVEERLPSDEEQRDEYGELVPFLVCEKDTTYPYRAFYDGKEWGDGLMRIRGITNWMPLPEPPIEKYTEGGT